MDCIQVLADVHGTCLDDVVWLGHANSLQTDACLRLNLLYEHFGLRGVESDACTTCASAGCSTTPMDISLCLLGWLDLNDEINVGYVETSRGDICGY